MQIVKTTGEVGTDAGWRRVQLRVLARDSEW
jgi:hypothetical protein